MTSLPTIDPTWTPVPERSNLLTMRFMAWLSLGLGRRVTRVVVHGIAAYFLAFAPSGRRASRDYLARALGRAPRWRDLYQHFFTFAATIHDRVYLANHRLELFDVELHGQDALLSLLASGEGVFLMGAHLGSFDVVRAIGRQHTDLRVAMVMHDGNARNINAVLTAVNPTDAPEIIALGFLDSMMRVSQRLAEGYAIGILADRTPRGDDLVRVQILGASAHIATGPFRMAALLRRPVVFMAGLYLGGNRYAIHFDRIADFSAVNRAERQAAIDAAITRYAALLDHYCRLAPYNWFNFFEFWRPAPVAAIATV
jgi:predicted LPLAT superfamily acyltransferase